MKQKIYADRTTFHGIEAPAGQEYQVVVDSLGKLKSEVKPVIPAQVNLIEGSNITITGTYPNLTISASGTVGTNWEDIGGDQSTVNLSGFTNDAGFITEVTESDVTQYETALTITESQISDLGDYLESGDNISELVNDVGYLTEADLPPSELQDLQSVMEQGSIATFVNPTEPLPEQVGFLFLGENGGFSNIYNRSGSNHSSGLSTSVNVDNGDNVGYVSGGTNFTALSNSFTSDISTRLNASIDGNDFGGELVIGTGNSVGASLRNEIFVSGDRTGLRMDSSSNVGIAIIDEIGEFGLSYTSDYSENGETDDLWIPSWGAVKAYADSAAGTDLAQGTRTSTTVPITSSTGTSATLEVATTTLAGVMSASDKTKLDGIEAGAEVNVNADWNAVSGDAQILNKPTIPTKTSQLENDSGFVTSSGVTSVSGTANQI